LADQTKEAKARGQGSGQKTGGETDERERSPARKDDDAMQEVRQANVGLDAETKCPECGEPIENVRMTCPNCGHTYSEDEYSSDEAGTDFRAGAALDDKGKEMDVTGDADEDQERAK
jgi:hypothetical protein